MQIAGSVVGRLFVKIGKNEDIDINLELHSSQKAMFLCDLIHAL